MTYQEWVRANWHVRHVEKKKRREKNAWAIYDRSPQKKALAYVNIYNSQAKHQSENLFFPLSQCVCVYGEAYVHPVVKVDRFNKIAFNTQQKISFQINTNLLKIDENRIKMGKKCRLKSKKKEYLFERNVKI